MRYFPAKIESKWQKRWLKEKIYEPDFLRAKKPFYNLMMFPYPSAEGLHVGNMYAFTGADIYGRFKRMQGFDVFEPIGLDGFGIHSENYALKIGTHPRDQARISEKNFYRQLTRIGNGFAWNERLETYDPEYYHWTQWIFIQMFKRGLAYRKKADVNWCPSCKTVLADEQVINGHCERCDSVVVKKELEQWFFKITDYAERLLKNLEKIDWSERIKIAQKNWIGKSEGALIRFQILWKPDFHSKERGASDIDVFTTRPDTLFGATYLALSPEHPFIARHKSQIANREEVEEYIRNARLRSDEARIVDGGEKTGVELKGMSAINPANSEKIPVWVSDYVLSGVGTGAIMAVPAHDQRDFEFAKKFGLPVKIVVCPHWPKKTCPVLDRAYTGEGHLVDSGKFDGMSSEEARWKITEAVGGKRTTQYRLRDWLISRQRYWGPPIPMIFCENCARLSAGSSTSRKKSDVRKLNRGEIENPGWIAVPEKDLPVKLPYLKNFHPTGTDKSPLASSEKFYKVRCPKCGSSARRETDVSDTFLDSAWYYIGFLAKTANAKFDILNLQFRKRAKRWLPVDMYIGGAEHAVLHLLYVRFLAMVFNDLKLVHFEEPFKKFRAHGLIIKDGAKMSKSRGNVVNPDEHIRVYGADAFRMYLMFLGPFEAGGDFRDYGIKGITRFLERTWRLFNNYGSRISIAGPGSGALTRRLHQTIKKVTEDIESLQYNTAISALMILLNEFEANKDALTPEDAKTFLKLLAPFAPHISEELYQRCLAHQQFERRNLTQRNIKFKRKRNGAKYHSIHRALWPKYDPKLIQEQTFELVIQVNGKMRGRVTLPVGVGEEEATKAARALPAIKKYVSGEPRKVIYVPSKLINFVV